MYNTVLPHSGAGQIAPQRRCPCLAILLLGLLSACQGYDVKVNDQVVYRPPADLLKVDVSDPGLDQCLRETVLSQKIKKAEQLQKLQCRNLEIVDLAGIATFVALTDLDLASNQITDIVPLSKLTKLQILYLQGNDIVDPSPLSALTALRSLDLRNNPALSCPGSASANLPAQAEVFLPTQCP